MDSETIKKIVAVRLYSFNELLKLKLEADNDSTSVRDLSNEAKLELVNDYVDAGFTEQMKDKWVHGEVVPVSEGAVEGDLKGWTSVLLPSGDNVCISIDMCSEFYYEDTEVKNLVPSTNVEIKNNKNVKGSLVDGRFLVKFTKGEIELYDVTGGKVIANDVSKIGSMYVLKSSSTPKTVKVSTVYHDWFQRKLSQRPHISVREV